jgi:hypothetical protein
MYYGEDMWLLTTLVATIGITALSFAVPKKYQFGFLAMMLWGLSLMLLVDHVMGYEGSGPFLEAKTEGLIESGAALGVALLIPVFMIWGISMTISKLKNKTVVPNVR